MLKHSLYTLNFDSAFSEFQIFRPEEPLMVLNERSISLKKILSRIPDEIFDRKKFLETIKYEVLYKFYLYENFCLFILQYLYSAFRDISKELRHGFLAYLKMLS